MRLRVFEARGCTGLEDAALAALCAADGGVGTRLERVGLRGCAQLSLEAPPAAARAARRQGPKRGGWLRRALFGAAAVTSADPVATVGHAMLISLDLRGCTGARDAAVAAVLKQCAQTLEDLDVGGCAQLENFVSPVIAHLPALRVVRCHGCAGLSDACAEGLLAAGAALLEADFSACTSLSSPQLRSATVRVLKLAQCTELESEAIGAIAQRCPALAEFEVSGVAIAGPVFVPDAVSVLAVTTPQPAAVMMMNEDYELISCN